MCIRDRVAGVPQIVPFEVTDADGAAALGVIYVPAVGSGGPVSYTHLDVYKRQLLTYTAAYGMAPYARGTIRVDISQPRPRDTAPTAMLDQAVVYGQTPALIDVLANDVDRTGRLLAVKAAEPVDGASLEVAVVRGRWLRCLLYHSRCV